MKRERVIELWLAGFVLVAGLIVVVVLLGTAAADGPPMSERADLSYFPIHNLLPTDNVYAFGHIGVVGNITKRNNFEVDPHCNEKDGCYPYGDGCEERDYYCMGNETGCNYTSSNRHTDGWVDTGNTRWVDVNECQEKEQKEQEYRDYKCSARSCHYSINDTKWIDTGIYNTTCNYVSLAPPEITSFAPLSYADDRVCNWRTFDVTINQAVNVSWYLNNTLVLTNESVLEAKCTLHAEVVGEHNVTAIASNANGSDMQTWIWDVTELQKECEGTDTSCGIYPNCGNCNEQDGCYPHGDGCEERDYYCMGKEASCNYTSSNRHTDGWVDTSNTRWVDVNKCQEKEQKEQEYRDYKCSAGSCNYSINDTKWIDTGIYNSTCNGVSLAPPEITSFAPLSYVDDTVGNWRTFDVTVSQTANVSWYLNDLLVLTNESVREAKCTLLADVVGEHNVTAIASNANGSDMQIWIWTVTSETPTIGTGTKTITQTIYVSNSFPMFSNAEYVHFTIGNDNITLTLDDNASFDGVCNLSDLMGRDVSVAGTTVELSYFPITYQGVSHDQKWVSAPSFDDTWHKLYLLSGSGLITTLDLEINENSTTTPIPKVVGVGDLVGAFDIQTAAEGINSADNHLYSQIGGVGYANHYVQYAPDTSYEHITFIPTFSQCERLQLNTNSFGSWIGYEAHMIGVAEGTEAVYSVSPDWNVSLDLDLEYFPITYQGVSHDQKWAVFPFFDDVEHKLYLLSGSGLITTLDLEINENSTTTPIPKVAGIGSLVGDINIQTAAEGINSADNHLFSRIVGVGFAKLYVQYAPDASYEDITFIPTFSQCERLQLNTNSFGSFIVYDVHVLGLATGVECLKFDGIPLDNVAINGTFDLTYHPVYISGDEFDEKWSVEPEQYEDVLVILRGTGTMTELNFVFNDSTAAHPEISSYGYLSGDYNITANILPHHMDVVADGPDVAAMNVLEQGGFGVQFGEGLNCACGDVCVITTGWWRDGGVFNLSDRPIQDAIDNATAGETICVKDGTYNENVDVNTPLTIRSENGADSTIVNALDPNDHVFEVTADHVNIIGFTVQNASDYGNAGIYLYNLGYCTISDNTASNNAEGIFINPSNDCRLTNNIVSNNDWHGIGLFRSSDCTLTNNIALNNGGRGIGLFNSSDCTLTNNIALNNYVGIKVRNSSNCMLDSNTASDNERGGIGLFSSSDCTVTSNTAFNNEIGIGLWFSSNNTLTSNNVSNNTLSDFRSADSHGNVVTDLTIASYPTTISFTYDDVGLKGVDTAPSDPEGKVNINKYVNVTGLTANSWIFMNVSYEEGDLGGVDENSLRMWRYDDGVWTEVPAPNGVNNVENYVYAKITGFSIFAPLGNPSGVLKPDLIITEKWLCWPDNCTICYNVTNTGNGTAPAGHNATLYADGVAVAHDHVPVDLAPGESYIGCFDGYVWTYTPPSDNITVCADKNETVVELDEDNNCLTNIWICGDVTGDGRVRTSDGRRIFRHLTFGVPIDNMWAADVTGDGRVRTSDGRRIFRHLTFGDPLNCNCSG